MSGKTKYNINDAQKIAKNNSGTCLSKKYIQCDKKLKWACNKNHIWSMSYSKVKSGMWCKICKMNKEKEKFFHKCKEIAKKNSGKCISDEYINNSTPMKWKCKNNHVWYAIFSNIQKGQWCGKCSGINIEKCYALAQERGGRCLSKECRGHDDVIKWECENKHVWTNTYTNVRNSKSWCAECRRIKISNKLIGSAKKLADIMGGDCLSNECKNHHDKIQLICAEGHIWFAEYNSVKNGYWCPYCAGNIKKTIHDYVKLATERGGKCLSKNIGTSRDFKTKWECENKHTWVASYRSVSQGNWCSKCKNKTQTKLFNLIKKIFSKNVVHYNYRDFEWLKTKMGGKQEIDIFVDEINLGIEYDGKQHFVAIEHWGGLKTLMETQRLDRLKSKKIKQHPKDVKHFIRFNYKEDITEEYVIKKIKKYGVNI